MDIAAPNFWIALKTAGVAAFAWIALDRLTKQFIDQPGLRTSLMASLVVRMAIGLGLFLVSYYRWPILPKLHWYPGFWMFAVDSPVYHHYGDLIAQAWARSTDVPDPELGIEYFLLVGFCYRLLGSYPLYPILLNGFLACICALLGYRLARGRFGPRPAALAAVLLAWWPSSLIWSGQLLKDTFSWTLILGALLLVCNLVRQIVDEQEPLRHRLARFLVMLMLATVMTRLRFYLGWALSLGAVLAIGPAAWSAIRQRRLRRTAELLVIPAALFVITAVARSLQVRELFCPVHGGKTGLLVILALGVTLVMAVYGVRCLRVIRDSRRVQAGLAAAMLLGALLWQSDRIPLTPRAWRTRAGLAALDRGELLRAQALFAQSVDAGPWGRQANLGLGLVLLRQGRAQEALATYDNYLRSSPSVDASRESVHVIISSLLIDQAIAQLRAGVDDEAMATFERAVGYSRMPIALINLGMVYASRRSFDAATRLLDEAQRQEQAELRPYAERLRRWMHVADQTALAMPFLPGLPMRGLSDEDLLRVAQHALDTRTPQPSVLTAFKAATDIAPLDEQLVGTTREATPESLSAYRKGFVSTGGHSLMDATATISSAKRLMEYLPRAIVIGLFAPFPWEWLESRGSTGVMRAFGSLDMILWYWLLPALIVGCWRVIRRGRPEDRLLLGFGLMCLLPIALVVANLGTLYRLRLQALMPLVILAASADPPALWRQILAWRPGHTRTATPPPAPAADPRPARDPLPTPAPVVKA